MKKAVLSVLLIISLLIPAVAQLPLAIFAEDSFVDLTTLTPQNVSVGWGSLCVNKDLNGGAIDMANDAGRTTSYEKGFVAHAKSSMDFQIENLGVTMFTSVIGADHNPNNAATTSTSVKFLVYADSALLYESPVLGYNDPALSIAVAIPAGAKTLRLVTDDVGGNSGDHSAWGIPRLYSDGKLLEKLADLQAGTDRSVYLTGAEIKISVVCKNLGGQEMTPEELTFASSDPAIGTVDENGVLTAKKAGVVRVTVTARDHDVTLEKAVAVSIMDKADVRDFSILSPSGKLKIDLRLDDQGMVSYTVAENGLTVLERSYIGIDTDYCDLSNALSFVRQIPVTEFDETYANISGKKSSVRNHFNETVLVLEKDVFFVDIYMRAYDDGFAYRFALRNKNGAESELTVSGETGTFALPAKSVVSAELISTLSSSFCYETGYSTVVTETLSRNKSQYVCFPALVNVANASGERTDRYMLLSESDLFSDSFYGSVMSVRGDNVYGMSQAPKISYGSVTKIKTDFSSPWRYGIVGSLGDIVESDLTENLAPAPEGDFSWVVPGVTAWMWLSEGYDGQRTESTIKDYVDLASEMGWKYLILDEGWQPNSSRPGRAYDGYFKYFDNLVKYAEEKGVGFIAWVKYVDLDTPEEREILREWAAKGIKGIKADFFDSEDPKTLEGFKAIYELCAECHLIVNCHGAGKPTGERRTWPNVINREAVNGEEYGGFWVNNAVVWAFTRGVVGPIDITPRLYPTASGNTLAVQLACNVIFESGIPCMASDSEDYRGFNGISFYKNLPAAWDDIHYIDGKVGEFVTLARRSGDIWYAATISNINKRGLSLPLDFLDDGNYYAVIYKDKSGSEIGIETKTVTKADTLEYGVQKQGGYVVKFIKADSALYLPKAIRTETELSLVSGFRDKIVYTLEGENIQIPDVLFESADPSVVSVDEKGNLMPNKPGKTTVTVCSIADRNVNAKINVTVKECPYELNREFEIVNPSKNGALKPALVLSDRNRIEMVTTAGNAADQLSYNEVAYELPDGDFTLTVNIESAPTVIGSSAGLIVRGDDVFAAVERVLESGNKISYRSSTGNKNGSLTDARAGNKLAPLHVTVTRTGDTLIFSCGFGKSGQKKYETLTIPRGTKLTASLFATNDADENEVMQFSGFTLNDKVIPFSVEKEPAEASLQELLALSPFSPGGFIGYAAVLSSKAD